MRTLPSILNTTTSKRLWNNIGELYHANAAELLTPESVQALWPLLLSDATGYISQHQHVTRANLTAAISRDGTVARGNTAAEALLVDHTSLSHLHAPSDDLREAPVFAGSSELGGLFLIVSHRHTHHYATNARVIQLSAEHWMIRRSSLLVYCNNPALSEDELLGYLTAFPHGVLRLLIRTELNAGYRCGHMHALAITQHVWLRFPWVVSLSGADVLMLPPFIDKLGAHLSVSSNISFWFDNFQRYAGHTSLCMDAFAFRSRPFAQRRVWHYAAARCEQVRNNVEEVLRWVVKDKFNLLRVPLGGRAGGCTVHTLSEGGLWHAGDMTAPERFLARHASNRSAFDQWRARAHGGKHRGGG